MVDTLSRKPHLCSITNINVDWKTSILVEHAKGTLANDILEGKLQDRRNKVVEELIPYIDRIYLILGLKMKENILRAYHDTLLTGHQGYYKTHKQVREQFSWKSLKGVS